MNFPSIPFTNHSTESELDYKIQKLRGSSEGVYTFHKAYPIECIENIYKEAIENNKEKIQFDNVEIKTHSIRIKTFMKNTSKVCVNCGRVGTHYRLQSNKNSVENPHLGLWSDDGIQFTKDHIIPKSKGGTNELDNLQIMCEVCNNAKKDNINTKKKNSLSMIFDKHISTYRFMKELEALNRNFRINYFKELIDKEDINDLKFQDILSFALEVYDYIIENNLNLNKNKYWNLFDKSFKKYIIENRNTEVH